ncbi:MAG: hypothetical protein LBH76_02405 [Propionibacteriaceae bacterium]|nr:hypothetical protein [Propionibacteriaceae bacterium]
MPGTAVAEVGYLLGRSVNGAVLESRNQIDLDAVGRPACLAVVTGTEYAYTLPSGVRVVPLDALGA